MDPKIDADLYVYSPFAQTFGDPTLVAKSINPNLGQTEIVSNFNSHGMQYVYLVVKGIRGYGNLTLNITSYIDTDPPYLAIINSPDSYTVHNSSLEIDSTVADTHTSIYYMTLISTRVDTKGNDISPFNQSLITQDYNPVTLWNVSNIEDGWYDISFLFYDGNNNTIESTPIRIAIVSHLPLFVDILFPNNSSLIYESIRFSFKTQSQFLGIARAELWLNSTYLVSSKDYAAQFDPANLYPTQQVILSDLDYNLVNNNDGWDNFSIRVIDFGGNDLFSANIQLEIIRNAFNVWFYVIFTLFGFVSLIVLNKLAKFILHKTNLTDIIIKIQKIPKTLQNRFICTSNKNKS
jgi:hypothetical protein